MLYEVITPSLVEQRQAGGRLAAILAGGADEDFLGHVAEKQEKGHTQQQRPEHGIDMNRPETHGLGIRRTVGKAPAMLGVFLFTLLMITREGMETALSYNFV